MKRASLSLLLLVPTMLLLGGCVGRTPAVRELYAGLREKTEALDASVLAGRRIVIDPGHGGRLGGVVGVDSLREADANLGVALYLWGLCTDAGAEVFLTRTADRDYLPSGSTNSGEDLKARIEKANEADPDVFISIHHNSNLELKRDMNKIEVYYKSDDPGASLELARDIETHLARNLGIERSETRPGNYFVLRHSKARSSVLGEASYLSHPAVEDRLKLAEKQKLEAEAYFLGLVSYFSRGVPSLERLTPERDSLAAPEEISFRVRTSLGVPIDPASARLSIGASEVVPFYDPADSLLRYPMDAELPNAPYVVRATVRSTGGATGRSTPYTISLGRPARHILALEPELKPDSVAALSVRVLDELAQPVADGLPMAALAGKGKREFSGETRSGVFTVEAPVALAHDPFVFRAKNVSDTIRFFVRWDAHTRGVYVRDAASGNPIPNALIERSGSPGVTSDAEGRALIPEAGRSETLLVCAKGYVPVLVDFVGSESPPSGSSVIALEPLFGGVLGGRRIALDPGGGGADPGGLGPSRLRGASVSLDVAKHLRDILVKAGACVTLTRDGEETISTQERVYLVNRSGAELAIGIRHGSVPDGQGKARQIRHYPGSAGGALISRKLAAELAALPPPDSFVVRESAEAFLTQTSAAACEVYCGSVENAAAEALMTDPQWARLEAENICAAIAAYFGSGNPPVLMDVRVKVMAHGLSAAGAAVDIDRVFIRSSDENGLAFFSCVTPGPHLITVRLKDGRTARFMTKREAVEAGEVVLELR